MVEMGLGLGLESRFACVKRKYRWMMYVDGVFGRDKGGMKALPPEKGARPSFNFKEVEVQHLNETVFYPIKPEFKPLNITLYDITGRSNGVTDWINQIYDASTGQWSAPPVNFKRSVTLEMYDGCGAIIEKWKYEDAYPSVIEYGDLDMSSSDYCVIDLTLRYDRAFKDNS